MAKRAGAKAVKAMEKVIGSEYVLSPEDATMYRALSARANFLSQDRADIQFSTKELCREFAVPNRNSYNRLKRLGRYLKGKPRLVIKYDWQKPLGKLTANSDSDWAGDKQTRKSTSGGIIRIGSHFIKSWSKGQTTIALSSAEAELYAILRTASESLGILSILQ